MAWAHVQDTPGSNGVASAAASSVNIGAFGSAVVINDYVVVWAWGGRSTTITGANFTCSDNGATPNTYTQLAFQNEAVQAGGFICAAIFVAKITSNPSSGNINPTISLAGAGQFIVGCAAEYSGGTTTTDGTNSNGSNTNSTPTAGSVTTTTANDLLLMVLGFDQSANLTGITDPASSTNVGKTLSETIMAGSGSYQILSGTVSGDNPSWTITGGSSGTDRAWAACVAALKPAAGSTAPVGKLVQVNQSIMTAVY